MVSFPNMHVILAWHLQSKIENVLLIAYAKLKMLNELCCAMVWKHMVDNLTYHVFFSKNHGMIAEDFSVIIT